MTTPLEGPHSADAVNRIKAIIEQNRKCLLDYATGLTGGDVAWAEDVVQDTFVRAWRHIDRLTPDRGSVRGWLLRVAHNRVMDGYRAARCRPVWSPLDETHDGAPVPDDQADLALRLDVQDLLRRLPEPQREAIISMYLEDRTAAGAADVLGVPVGTIKSRVHYGLQLLRTVAGVKELGLTA